MAKFYNNRVKSGRLAGSVFAVRNGVTIERAYQPFVNNPKSSKQTQTRSKLKLMSQLSAVMAPVIAMRRVGLASPRNMFVKNNFNAVTIVDSNPTIDLQSITLTGGITSLPTIDASRNEGGVLVNTSAPVPDVDQVVFIMFYHRADDTLMLIDSAVEDTPNTSGVYAHTFANVAAAQAVVIYAYGIRFNSDAAAVTFGNIEFPVAQNIAKLIVSSTLSEADFTLTETQVATLTSQA